MNVTKNDLSYDHATLDYQAMLHTAEVAFAHSKREVDRELTIISQYAGLPSCFYFNTARIESEAKHLNIIAETLHTLREGLTRSELEIVNKPDKED